MTIPGDPRMSFQTAYFFVCLTILLTVFGQFAIKWVALEKSGSMEDMESGLAYVLRMLTNPWVISALAAAFLASVSWMLAMTRLPLSHAFPLTALNFVFVVIGSCIVFGEPLTTQKTIGLILLVLGIVIGSRG